MSRPIYQTHQSAQSAALALALKGSPSHRAKYIQFSGGDHRERAVCAAEGGPAFAVKMLTEGWEVEQLSDAELVRRTRIGLRREVDALIGRARKSKERARELLGTKFAAWHEADAKRDLLEAERLLSDTEEITSSERDSRVA